MQTRRIIDHNRRSPKSNKSIFDQFSIYDERVTIYRTKHSGDVWQFRMYVQDEQRYVRKSLRTRDKEIAIKRAEDEFIFYQSKLRNGEKLFSITASELVERYLNHVSSSLVATGQLSAGRFANIRTQLKHYVEFVGGNSKIQNVDQKFFGSYHVFRHQNKVTVTTVRNESITIKAMYRFAVEEGLIAAQYKPAFVKLKVPQNETRRDGYTILEYRQLTGVGKDWYKQSPNSKPEEIYYRRLIHDFVVLQANFGFRTQELRLLKWSDVTVHEDSTATVYIRTENAKTKKAREIRSRRGDVFSRLKEYIEPKSGEDFVFQKYLEGEGKGTTKVLPKDILYDYFKQLTDAVSLKHPQFDKAKTLYSLRHFFITTKLLANQNVYDIARFAGTSLTQIEAHYDNVKDAQISQKLLKRNYRFDKRGELVLEE
jgi:integrase